MEKLSGFLAWGVGATVGGAAGWYLGAQLGGMMTSTMLCVVGTALGVYAGRRLAEYLGA